MLLLAVGIGIAGEGFMQGTAKKVTLDLGQATKDKLAVLETKTETTCLEYECIEWDKSKPPKCIQYTEKCVREETRTINIGITAPKIIPKGCDENICCYDLIEEPYYHRLGTCFQAGKDKNANEAIVLDFLRNDLQQIADNATREDAKTKQPANTPDAIDIEIK